MATSDELLAANNVRNFELTAIKNELVILRDLVPLLTNIEKDLVAITVYLNIERKSV